ncbi:RiPP maturation radical SAM C-methyltransferase [Streptomyces silvisoli]|uniref:RiPP maturation radical SAM C-methyltransferase n=1 Tax=Streptomyces silvisoli TaxID=3034235 RepID=A0ABT5ZSW8_9ACTN|nr:RiPP maturation radical SAM C-methyltransferase [Streptomyces silvisoli]MDF3292614.1 RiPP maturation radical SAM C-methyltransferase [Streptomyces silvisoli]
MRILLVNMPWAPIDLPSLALGILKRSVDEHVPGGAAEVLHADIDFVDWITKRTEFSLTDYGYYSLASYFLGCGDWVFSSALYDDRQWRVAEFTSSMNDRLPSARMRMTTQLHEMAPDFIEHIAERIVAHAPDVVGFTSTFQQNTAALAAAKCVKRLAPRIVTVMGGANCDGKQGEAVHRNFPFVDYVVRGEGEESFPGLLESLGGGRDFATVPGLCWRDPSSASVANPMSTTPLPPAAILSPDYSGYFERLATSAARSWVEPKLVVEGARGCWWGEKHHCTFCGLNGSFMQFRSKNPSAFFEEIVGLARTYHVLDMYVVDNILDMGYVTSLLPRIVDSGFDLRMHYEIKSNMRRGQLQTLADAGLIYVQPGVESLSSRVLGLMDKGVTGCQNVRMMRDGAAAGLSVVWNYLHGFPGEAAEDYDEVTVQLPALEHLNPPVEESARIAIERFSPYFNNPDLGFCELRPAEPYRLTYDLPDAEMFDLAYVFDVPPRGVGEKVVERLNSAIRQWKQSYARSRLTYCDLEDRILLVSRRRAFDWHVLELNQPVEMALFRLLDQPHSVAAAVRKLRDAHGNAVDHTQVSELLRGWRERGLVFENGGQVVHVAVPAVNEELLRMHALRRPSADELASATV